MRTHTTISCQLSQHISTKTFYRSIACRGVEGGYIYIYIYIGGWFDHIIRVYMWAVFIIDVTEDELNPVSGSFKSSTRCCNHNCLINRYYEF